jgi:hypothetical protein
MDFSRKTGSMVKSVIHHGNAWLRKIGCIATALA